MKYGQEELLQASVLLHELAEDLSDQVSVEHSFNPLSNKHRLRSRFENHSRNSSYHTTRPLKTLQGKSVYATI